LLACRFDPRREIAGHNATLLEFIDATCIQWHGVKLDQPDWGLHSHSLAATMKAPRLGVYMHSMFNTYWEPLDFEIPPVPAGCPGPWRQWVDTSRESPQDIYDWRSGLPAAIGNYRVQPRSLVILLLPES
jgi:isoamylase